MAETETPQKDYLQPLDPHEEGVTEGMVLSVIDHAEINQQIATAHRFPRSVTAFRRRVYEIVTIDVDTAESCIYAIPRDNKTIVGPSIRFAEILLVGWGNHRSAAEVTHIDEEFITASGTFFDLETNGAIQAKVMRRITGKPSRDFPKGKRFSQDMIATTGNAASSIALRNAILRGVPKAIWGDLFDEARKVAAGSAQTFAARRDKVIKELGIQGATPDQIFLALGVKGVEDIQTDHIVQLRGLQNAIKDGELTVEDAFKPGLAPGQVAPAQPARSDFDRQPQEGAATSATATVAQAKADPKPTPAAQQQEAQQTMTHADAFEDWYKDVKAELAKAPKAKDVADLRGDVLPQLEGYPEKEKEFNALCDAKTKEILDAFKKNRGK